MRTSDSARVQTILSAAAMPQHRKTRKRFEIHQQARFLTFSCYQRLPLFNNDDMKRAFVDELALSRQRVHFELVAWVIMPEHVHLIIVPALPEFPVSKVLSDLKAQCSNRIMRRWDELNAPVLTRLVDSRGKRHFWQVGGGYDRNLESNGELIEKVNYCHTNPVSRGLVASPLDWAWSSARWYAGDRDEAMIAIDLNAW